MINIDTNKTNLWNYCNTDRKCYRGVEKCNYVIERLLIGFPSSPLMELKSYYAYSMYMLNSAISDILVTYDTLLNIW